MSLYRKASANVDAVIFSHLYTSCLLLTQLIALSMQKDRIFHAFLFLFYLPFYFKLLQIFRKYNRYFAVFPCLHQGYLIGNETRKYKTAFKSNSFLSLHNFYQLFSFNICVGPTLKASSLIKVKIHIK